MEGDDDIPQLPADTLELLQSFQREKDARAKQFEDLKSKAEKEFQDDQGKLSMDLFGEDWNASQFWYTEETANLLARQLLEGATEDSAIAIVSAPSVYVALRNILAEDDSIPRPRLCLLEYDCRFEVIGPDFVFYDYMKPICFSSPDLKGQFDRIVCDPPFLSEDCQTKAALTVRYLAREWASSRDGGLRFISCTGERMESVVLRLYAKIGTRTTDYEPQHSKGLSNEFFCYANFEGMAWKWRS